ncbi:MAG: TetR/AcrR family transcriptional regulator [Actinomycetota bacterium]
MPETITEETKQRILDTAAALLNESPVRTLRIQEIAMRADVAPSTIYKAYNNKYELFVYAAESLFTNQIERIRESIDESKSPIEILRHSLTEFFTLARDYPHAASYLFAAVPFAYSEEIASEQAIESIAALGSDVRQRLLRRITDAVDAGQLGGDPEALTDHCVISAFGYVGIAATGRLTIEPAKSADTTLACLAVIGAET